MGAARLLSVDELVPNPEIHLLFGQKSLTTAVQINDYLSTILPLLASRNDFFRIIALHFMLESPEGQIPVSAEDIDKQILNKALNVLNQEPSVYNQFVLWKKNTRASNTFAPYYHQEHEAFIWIIYTTCPAAQPDDQAH